MGNSPLGITVSMPTGPLFSFSTKAGSFIAFMSLAQGKR